MRALVREDRITHALIAIATNQQALEAASRDVDGRENNSKTELSERIEKVVVEIIVSDCNQVNARIQCSLQSVHLHTLLRGSSSSGGCSDSVVSTGAACGLIDLPPERRRVLGARGEDLDALLRDEDGVLELRAALAVGSDAGPVVEGPRHVLPRAHVDHGLDGEHHAGLALADGLVARVVRDRRRRVEGRANAVTAGQEKRKKQKEKSKCEHKESSSERMQRKKVCWRWLRSQFPLLFLSSRLLKAQTNETCDSSGRWDGGKEKRGEEVSSVLR